MLLRMLWAGKLFQFSLEIGCWITWPLVLRLVQQRERQEDYTDQWMLSGWWPLGQVDGRALLGIAIVHQLLRDAPRDHAWISSSGESMVSRNIPNQQVLAAGRANCLTQSVDTENSQRKTQPKNSLYKAASILTYWDIKTKNCTAHRFFQTNSRQPSQIVQTVS